ncbi:MAG: gamma-aminobutyraldehyde dehydrogenase [Desulfobacterales bacterium]|nr:gamma-aminobutyraldehyde dehydrogenase [Desulfobacterales bacterium]
MYKAETQSTSSVDIIKVINPANGQKIGTVPRSTVEDVNTAVLKAKINFTKWSKTTPGERSLLLHRLADIVARKAAEFAQIETLQTGKPIRFSTEFDVAGTIDNIRFFAGAARNLEGKAAAEYSSDHTSFIRREPIGVIGSIAPWNYPLQMAAWKILPAIAAGNTIVLKPASNTPLTAIMFAEACLEAGIPDGVVNVVCGPGGEIGAALISHPDVKMVSLTGDTDTGKKVMESASKTVKRTHLELGGKAPFLVFDDAGLEAAIQGAVAGALINSGQDCTAATRALVQRPLYDRFVEGVVSIMEKIKLGDPMDPSTDIGPLVSFKQQERVNGFVRRAEAEGCQILCGGNKGKGALKKGAYFEPTVITKATPESEIFQKEIFGPVLLVLPFTYEQEGIDLANHVDFGLAASVWTSDITRAMNAVRSIHAGTVWVNDHIPIVSEMPHGGIKQSGFGKDMSGYSFDEYTAIKHVMIELTGQREKDWHRVIFKNKLS